MSEFRSTSTGRHGAPVALDFAPSRKGPMSPYEIAWVRQRRTGVRVSWAALADMLQRCEHDVRLACDPTYAIGEAARG